MVAVILPALLLQADWKTVAPSKERFSVRMPTQPQSQTREFTSGADSVQARIYQAVSKQGVFNITVMHPMGKMTSAQLQAQSSAFKEPFLKAMRAKETGHSKGKLGIYPGERTTFVIDKVGKGEYWALNWKGDFYAVTAVAMSGGPGPTQTFLKSFKLK
ncbi:hypothetical protein EON79_19670 [bacterium]|nr:MAG: hypothetical protein EON79_19670 [bacterium]